MYKGKFDQKKKGSNVHDIVAQRNQPAAPDMTELKPKKAAAPRPDAQRPAAPQTKAAPQRPAQPQKAVQKPVQAAPQKAKAAPQKKGPRLGGVIFYTLYFLFILLFFIATFVGLIWLRGWLVDFEASQPTVKSEQVFTQLFTDPDWDALYTSAGVQDTPFEGKEEFVAYMENKIGDAPLNYLETSGGLSGKKYVVRLGEEKVATFTLVDKNKVENKTLENITELPDWQLGAVDVFFERSDVYRIQKVADHIAYVNGVALDDNYTIQKATTRAEEFLPKGVTSAKMYTQEITGLMSMPTVTITDKAGNEMEVVYDEATKTFIEQTGTNAISEEERQLAIATAELYSKYMIEEANRGDLAKYFDNAGAAYKRIVKFDDKRWMQGNNGHEFANVEVSNYERYNEDIFSVRVVMDLNVTRTDNTVKTYPYDNTIFFHKLDSGKWKAFEMVNDDVAAPVGQVRLTFMDGETQLHSSFFDTTKSEIVTPLLPTPEGKVFSGWVRKDVNEEGVTELTVVFQPDETGKAVIPEGMYLEPMTLYALFEDADKVTVPEAAPETTAETEGVE